MKITSLLFCLLLCGSTKAATVAFVAGDQTLTNTATNSAHWSNIPVTNFVVTSNSGVGTNPMTVNYLVTMDLTSYGGPSNATYSFAANFAATSTNAGAAGVTTAGGHLGVTDGVAGDNNNINPGESITATLTPGASYGAAFNLDGFHYVSIYGVDPDDMPSITSDTGNTGTNIAFFPSATPFTQTFSVTTGGTGNGVTVGLVSYRLSFDDTTVIPEPSRALLLGIGLSTLLLRRRRNAVA